MNTNFSQLADQLNTTVRTSTTESNGHSVITNAGVYTNPEWLRNPNA